jgi:glycosyltransferase involved in cell wall biosynthesis
MISLIIPSYRNPECLDICLRSAIEGQANKNEIIVVVDGYVNESQHILDKYKDNISVLPLEENQGMQMALNLGVYNASNERICIVNDDNVLSKGWDTTIIEDLKEKSVLTINQVEPTGPGIFEFPVKDFGSIENFNYEAYLEYETTISKKETTPNGGIFPFAMWKMDYMIVGGFDTLYKSPFICDWDFFLKLELNGLLFERTHKSHFYHFGSSATKNGKEGEAFKATEGPAASTYIYKWGTPPTLYSNNSHRPKGQLIKGLKF